MRSIAALLLLVNVGPVQAAIVLDFESLRSDDSLIHDHAGLLEFSGFQILSVPPPGNAFLYRSAGTLNPLFASSTALFNGQSNAENVLRTSDGGAFALLSIDLAVLPPGASDPLGLSDPGPFDLTFTGTLASGGTVTNTFTINNTFLTLETFTFTGFGSVVSVSWFQGPGFNPPGPSPDATHQFDNITLAPVPEPSSLVTWLAVAVVVTRFASRLPAGRRSSRVRPPLATRAPAPT